MFAVCQFAAGAAANLQISSETAPAGGFAQIKIYAAKPAAISTGHIVVSLDATAFGPGAMVGLFGANGDAMGVATTKGANLDIQFSSATGGIGQLAGVPAMVISVPVLAAAAGRTVAVSATSPDASAVVASGSVTVQGTLSVGKIYAGMGVVPAGTVVPVYGSGFTVSTGVEIDSVVVASTQFVSSTELDVTLGGAAELVGKQVRVRDGGGEFDYFCFQPGDPVNLPENTATGQLFANVQPLFPVFAVTNASTFIGEGVQGGASEIQNPNITSTVVNISTIGLFSPSRTFTPVTIPPGSWAIVDGAINQETSIISDVPVRIVAMEYEPLPPAAQPVIPTVVDAIDFAASSGSALVLAPPSLFFDWQLGTAAPPPQTVSTSNGNGITSATVTSGVSWLTVALTEQTPLNDFTGGLTVSVSPAQLAVGTYQGSIYVTQEEGPSRILPVTLTVTNTVPRMINAAPATISFSAPSATAAPYSQTISVTSSAGPTPFTVSTFAGGGSDVCCYAWLDASPTSGTTPATITVTWDSSVTSQTPYYQPSTSASILIAGPANSITIPATFNVTGVQTYQTSLGGGGLGPNGVVFSAQTGTGPQMQTIYFYPPGTATVTVSQPWISAAQVTSGGSPGVLVTVSPAALAPGTHSGVVTIGEQGIAPISVPVTLGIWSTAPGLTSTVSSMTFVQQVGEPPPPEQATEIDSGGVPVSLKFDQGAQWLNLVDRFTTTPALLWVGVVQAPTTPGQYNGSFTVEGPGGSVYVPVTLLVEPGPVTPPVISQVVNAASGIPGAVAAGEIVSVRGYGVGASLVSGVRLDPSGMPATALNGLQVTFDGIAAGLVYTSANQTNLVVPTAVAGKSSTVMQVSNGTLKAQAWTLPVVAAAPGMFTVDATGTGQGAIVNQDGTVNSTANSAARGSVASIYGTGAGTLPVTVTVGGIDATVQYAGAAPGEIAGVLQVNFVVPQDVGIGTSVPVVVRAGGVAAAAVGMAVK